jgi:MoaA/NifB/PqqE/SkfB family radical SAM enzyme
MKNYKLLLNSITRFSSDLLRKNSPNTYKKFRKFKIKTTYSHSYFKNLHQNNINLIHNIKKVSYYDWKKQKFLLNKNTISNYAFIEINNSCNINCVMCDTKSSTRQKSIMKVELFEEIIKELKNQKISTIGLHTIGDPLVNTRLKYFFEILRKYNFKTSISTNGLLLKKNIETLIEYFDICPDIRFSIDGVNKRTYEKIRFGGNYEELLENLDLAVNKLKPLGFRLSTNLTLSKDNLSELGQFIVFFSKYFDDPFHNISMNFMTSLSPSNNYFLANNLMEEKTFLNKFCKYTSRFSPYLLVNGKVSVCCRDYDGSLIVGDFTKEKNFNKILKDEPFSELQKFQQDTLRKKSNQFSLCESCYEVDERTAEIWINALKILLFFNKNKDANFYQGQVERLLLILRVADPEQEYLEFIKDNSSLLPIY